MTKKESNPEPDDFLKPSNSNKVKMFCSYCKKEILSEDMFVPISYYGECVISPKTQYRCGFWDFHARCFHELMEKANFRPEMSFPTGIEKSSKEVEKEIIEKISENISLSIDQEMIDDLNRRYIDTEHKQL